MFELISVAVAFGAGWYLRGKFGTLAEVWTWIKSKFTSTTPTT